MIERSYTRLYLLYIKYTDIYSQTVKILIVHSRLWLASSYLKLLEFECTGLGYDKTYHIVKIPNLVLTFR